MNDLVIAGVPIRYVGRQGEAVYVPDADTLVLATAAVGHIRATEGHLDVLELGSGRGIAAIGAAQFHRTRVWATDVNPAAREATKETAIVNGVSVRVRRGQPWPRRVWPGRRWDLILSNPPYLPTPLGLVPSPAAVAYDGGRDGRDMIRKIAAGLPHRLKRGGSLIMVVSQLTSPEDVALLLEGRGLNVEIAYAGRIPWGPVSRELWSYITELFGDSGDPLKRLEDQERLYVVTATRPGGSR